MKTIIKLQNLTYLSNINEISATIKEGEITIISSSNNNAASTLLTLVSGLIKPDNGAVLYNGKNVYNSPLNIGYLFNSSHIKECCDSINNIPESFKLNKNNSEINYFLINHYLQTFGLVNYKSPSSISCSETALKLFKSLIATPELLLVDEPFKTTIQGYKKFYELLYHVVRQDKKVCIISAPLTETIKNIADNIIQL